MADARPDRKIDKEQLTKDAVSVVQQLVSAWDGEVDVVVMLVPKGLGPTAVISARSIQSNDFYRQVLRQDLSGIGDDKDIKSAGRPS